MFVIAYGEQANIPLKTNELALFEWWFSVCFYCRKALLFC
jgi:hypothetical protein